MATYTIKIGGHNLATTTHHMRIALHLAFITVTVFFTVFLAPALAHLAWWSVQDRPASWREANWSSAMILPDPAQNSQAMIYVMNARTGGIKGAFATHSWIVTKQENAARYDRYDVVGWGRPVRKNAYDADGRWYSNVPEIRYQLEGREAARLIPKIEAAIRTYPWRNRGDYTLWPGPNSNTFVATILRNVPELAATLPPTAIGKDYPADGNWLALPERDDWRATLGGYAGITLGPNAGLEVNFLGLVTGWNPATGEVKVPGFGSF